jgi:hypothetical protein
MNWYEVDSSIVDKDPLLDRQRHEAYANVFLKTDNGKQVLRDILIHAGQFDAENYPAEDAQTFFILSGFVSVIKKKCGIVDQMELIEAMAAVGQKYIIKMPVVEERDVL